VKDSLNLRPIHKHASWPRHPLETPTLAGIFLMNSLDIAGLLTAHCRE